MDPPRGPESFPPDDPRAGLYQPGVSHVIGRDVSAEKAASLVQGGGYTYCDPPEAPAASESEPEAPAEEE
ncbi:hypothetical protein D3C72_2176900 [compost metagenome]